MHAILLIFKAVKHQYNLKYSFITITIKMSIMLANFGKYAISDCPFITCQNLHFGKYVRWSCLSVCLSVCLFVCLYGNFTKSQKRLSQSSPDLVTSKHQSMVPASSLDKNVAQITRSRGQKLGQILKSP